MNYLHRTGVISLLVVIASLATGAENHDHAESREVTNQRLSDTPPYAKGAQKGKTTPQSSDATITLLRIPEHSGAGEQVTWHVVAGGGGSVSAGMHTIDVSIGQNVTGLAKTGGVNVVVGYVQSFGPPPCCFGTTGNVNMAGIVDLSDLSALVSYLTGGGFVITCPEEANVNRAGIVDLSDLSALVSYLTGGGFVLPNCV